MSRDASLAKDLAPMMYGFGDDAEPLPESVLVVEDLVKHHVRGLCTEALRVQSLRDRKVAALEAQSVVYTVKSDHRKFRRVMELLTMSERLKELRRPGYDPSKADA